MSLSTSLKGHGCPVKVLRDIRKGGKRVVLWRDMGVFQSTYMLRNNQGAKKDLGDVKSAMKDVEDIKCVKKDIERIREE
jgi:hypothetical protein